MLTSGLAENTDLLGPFMTERLNITRATHRSVREEARTNPRKQLHEGAQVRADRDLHLAEEWCALDEDVQPRARPASGCVAPIA